MLALWHACIGHHARLSVSLLLAALECVSCTSHAVWSLAGAGYGGSSYMDPYGTMRGRNTANMTPEESASLQLLLPSA